MIQPSHRTITPREILNTLKEHWKLWVLPTAGLTLLALVYAVVRTPEWQASQALVVRDEGGSDDPRQGRFEDEDLMKTVQETIVEISHNNSVLAAALAQVGPPTDYDPVSPWPTQQTVEAALASIQITPPNGAVFGKTEVIYLLVKDPERKRAAALATAMCDQIDRRLGQLRDYRAKSIISELEENIIQVRADLEAATHKLETLERGVGSDLGELRSLNNTAAGDSNLRASLSQIKSELRRDQAEQDADQKQLALLSAAKDQPDTLIATPSQLLESQPALRRLKEGLVDAQLNTSTLSGSKSADHPHVRAAIEAEELVRHQLHNELELAIRGLEADIEVRQALISSREEQLDDVSGSLNRLAGLRARYSNLLAEKQNHAEVLDRAQKQLAEARASQTSAQTASLLARLDGPEIGAHPLGPGRTVIVLGGFAGGLLVGFGLVFLFTPIAGQEGRRFTDLLGNLPGRRWTDRMWGRRQADRQEAQSNQGPARRAEETARDRRAEAAQPAGRRGEDERDRRMAEPAGRECDTPATTESASNVVLAAASPQAENTSDRRQGDRRSS